PGHGYRLAVLPSSTSATDGPNPSDSPGVLAGSDKPSIAVLPFINLSGDLAQECFSDGLADEVILALSRNRSLLVIARNSSFIYRGQAVDVRQIARELC